VVACEGRKSCAIELGTLIDFVGVTGIEGGTKKEQKNGEVRHQGAGSEGISAFVSGAGGTGAIK